MSMIKQYNQLAEGFLDDLQASADGMKKGMHDLSVVTDAAANSPDFTNKAALGVGATAGGGMSLIPYLMKRRTLKSAYENCLTDRCREKVESGLSRLKANALIAGVASSGVGAVGTRLLHGLLTSISPKYRDATQGMATGLQVKLHNIINNDTVGEPLQPIRK